MPITPFHGGVGILGKGVAPRFISFTAFCATQIVIDLEAVFHLLRGSWPLHRFLHTYLGATLACTVTVLALRWFERRFDLRWAAMPTLTKLLAEDLAVLRALPAVIVTIIVGVLGQIVPDSIMHLDIRPLAPFDEGNGLQGLLTVRQLRWALIFVGGVGVAVALGRWLRTHRALIVLVVAGVQFAAAPAKATSCPADQKSTQ